MTTKKSRVEELIAEASTVQNKALKTALQAHAKAEEEKQARELLSQFTIGRNMLNTVVSSLQSIRKQEEAIKKRVTLIDKALEQFKTDGNWELFCKTTGW